jgi:hypothetical protein
MSMDGCNASTARMEARLPSVEMLCTMISESLVASQPYKRKNVTARNILVANNRSWKIDPTSSPEPSNTSRLGMVPTMRVHSYLRIGPPYFVLVCFRNRPPCHRLGSFCRAKPSSVCGVVHPPQLSCRNQSLDRLGRSTPVVVDRLENAPRRK